MDVLAGSGLEPQLAIPVIVVVVGALLVYIFGFQPTEEPSMEHLAVLQSASSYKNRSVNSTFGTKGKTSSSNGSAPKAKANGHVVSEKSNGSVKKPSAVAVTNKENRPPVVKIQGKKENLKDPANKPADFESGDWIPAVSRKEKKVKKPTSNKEESSVGVAPPSPSKKGRGGSENVPAAAPVPLVAAAVAAAVPGSPTKAPKIEDLLAEMKMQQEKLKENHSTQTSPEKKASPPAVLVEAKKENSAPEVKKATKAPVAAAPESEGKDTKIKSNIAFDEMGGQADAWEEAKSRGNKKRRVRKD